MFSRMYPYFTRKWSFYLGEIKVQLNVQILNVRWVLTIVYTYVTTAQNQNDILNYLPVK